MKAMEPDLLAFRIGKDRSTPRSAMTEDPGNLKLQRPKHLLAMAIGGALGVSTIFAVYKLIGIDTERFWPFMVLVVGGSFIGGFPAQKIASK